MLTATARTQGKGDTLGLAPKLPFFPSLAMENTHLINPELTSKSRRIRPLNSRRFGLAAGTGCRPWRQASPLPRHCIFWIVECLRRYRRLFRRLNWRCQAGIQSTGADPIAASSLERFEADFEVLMTTPSRTTTRTCAFTVLRCHRQQASGDCTRALWRMFWRTSARPRYLSGRPVRGMPSMAFLNFAETRK